MMGINPNNTSNPLKIAHWNANGLNNKLQELKLFIHKNEIDIMTINETKYTAKNHCKVQGYICYRQDRPPKKDINDKDKTENPGGGILIFVKETLKHSELKFHVNNEFFATIGIKIGNTAIYSAYISDKSLDTQIFDKIFSTCKKVIIIGDFNARHSTWNCVSSNENGRILNKYIDQKTYVLLFTDDYTYYPYNTKNNPSTIDLALIKNIKNINIEVINDLDSDHLPIILTLNSKVKQNPDKKFFDYSKADWLNFRNYINSNFKVQSKFRNKKDVDIAIKNTTEIIQKSSNINIPLVTYKPKLNNYNPEIRSLINRRNKLRKLIQRTGSEDYKKERNEISRDITCKIAEFDNQIWQKRLEKLTPSNNSLWKLSKYFTRKSDNRIPTLQGPNGPVLKDKEKANLLATQFYKVHKLTEEFGNKEHNIMVENTYKQINNEQFEINSIKFVTPNEIKEAIKRTKSKKAPGRDGIQNIILKNLPQKIIAQLTNIFNACFRLSYFPKYWKTANILAFKKPKKNKSLPESYRPISLLPTLSKIFERIILNRIINFENESKIIIPEQFGFMKNKSTVQQLVRITNTISNNFNINKSTAMILLDIEKAFDTVWHQGLIYKLAEYKVPLYIIKIIIHYLRNRKFFTTVNNRTSKTNNVEAGVPQGSILGPILFLYFINDLPKHSKTEIALFADDTAILSSSWRKSVAVKNANEHFQQIRNYFHTWKIKINDAKTELIIFSKKVKENDPSITIGNLEIKPTKEVKYLGVILDKNLNYTSHVNKTRSKTYGAISSLYNLMNQKSNLSIKNKLLLYKMVIRPIMLYAAPIWSNTCNSNINKFEIIQNKVLKKFSEQYKDLRNVEIRKTLNILTVKENIFKLAINFFKVNIKKNDLLKDIAQYNHENAPFKIKYKLPHQIFI